MTNSEHEDRKKKGFRGKTETLNCCENKNRFEGKKHLETIELLREMFMKKDKRKARDKDGIKQEGEREKWETSNKRTGKGWEKDRISMGNVEEFRKNY